MKYPAWLRALMARRIARNMVKTHIVLDGHTVWMDTDFRLCLNPVELLERERGE